MLTCTKNNDDIFLLSPPLLPPFSTNPQKTQRIWCATMRTLVKIVGRDEMVSMCHARGESSVQERADLVQRYEVAREDGIPGYTLLERREGEVVKRSTHPCSVLPIAATHRQAYYELGVSGMVSNLTSGTNGAGYVLFDGGNLARNWLFEGAPHHPGLLSCAVDQLYMDLQSLAGDTSHTWTVHFGAAVIQPDQIIDLLAEGPGAVSTPNAGPRRGKSPRRAPSLAECRKTKSMVFENAKLRELPNTASALQLIQSVLNKTHTGQTVLSFCVEASREPEGVSKLHWLHFVSFGSEPAVLQPKGGGAQGPIGFRTSLKNCMSAIDEKFASIPYQRHRLTHFLRSALSGQHQAALMTCLTPYAPFAGVHKAGDSFREAEVLSETATWLDSGESSLATASLDKSAEVDQDKRMTRSPFLHPEAALYKRSQPRVSPTRTHHSSLLGWNGHNAHSTSQLTDGTEPPTPVIGLDFTNASRSPALQKQNSSPRRAGDNLSMSPRRCVTHHVVKQPGAARARSPLRYEEDTAVLSNSPVNTAHVGNSFTYASIKKNLPTTTAEVVPEERKKTRARSASVQADAVKEAAVVKQEFEMYRNVMDATLLRLRSDVVRLGKEKEEVRRASEKRERAWRKEQGETVVMAKELKQATRRVEELESQRSRLQGEFHEELVKLDRRQQILVEEKLRTEADAQDWRERAEHADTSLRDSQSHTRSADAALAKENADLRNKTTRLEDELAYMRKRIEDLERAPSPQASPRKSPVRRKLSHQSHQSTGLDLPLALGGSEPASRPASIASLPLNKRPPPPPPKPVIPAAVVTTRTQSPGPSYPKPPPPKRSLSASGLKRAQSRSSSSSAVSPRGPVSAKSSMHTDAGVGESPEPRPEKVCSHRGSKMK